VLLLAAGQDALPGFVGPRIQVHRCIDTADLVGRAMAGAADAALVAPDAAGMDAAVVAKLRSHGCRVLGLVRGASEAEIARRIGIGDHLAYPVDSEVLRLLLAAPDTAAARRQDSVRQGTVVAVWGPPGAPGRTTVSALLAVGAMRSGRRVIVVDADAAAAQWSLLASSGGPDGLGAALRRVAQGSADVDDLLLPQCEGLQVLSAAPEPSRWVEANPALLPGLLDVLAQEVDVVVVDTGADIRQAHPAYDVGWAHDSAALARAALGAADEVVSVLSADPVGVHRFASWWPVLQQQAVSGLLVANRMGVPRAGRHPQQQVAGVLRTMGIGAARVDIPWDTKAADGLLAANWTAAKGWRDVPQRLWSAVGAAATPVAAG
jgi:MinD-like ATPase involved in chromosome partitioning or flagellar assembly